jgi:N-acetyl-alpha-D-muramate 1-phosphate uridylyltransferase
MIFAAGFGTRMGVLTANKPKPLIKVAGLPLIDHALLIAESAGVSPVVVNTHYLADQLADHLKGRPVQLSHEKDAILETGGGLRKARPALGPGPVMTLNSDAVWTGQNPLAQLAAHWDGSKMDGLLLLLPALSAKGHSGKGDFLMGSDGRLTRAKGNPGLVYLGAQIIRTEALEGFDQAVFSLNLLWDKMLEEGRLYGMIHKGSWCDVGRPEGIAEAEAMMHLAHHE